MARCRIVRKRGDTNWDQVGEPFEDDGGIEGLRVLEDRLAQLEPDEYRIQREVLKPMWTFGIRYVVEDEAEKAIQRAERARRDSAARAGGEGVAS